MDSIFTPFYLAFISYSVSMLQRVLKQCVPFILRWNWVCTAFKMKRISALTALWLESIAIIALLWERYRIGEDTILHPPYQLRLISSLIPISEDSIINLFGFYLLMLFLSSSSPFSLSLSLSLSLSIENSRRDCKHSWNLPCPLCFQNRFQQQ